MNNDFLKLKKIVVSVFGVDDISLETAINKLDTVSEDNDRFFELFEKEFDVDMEDFYYYDYFYDDEFILLSLITRFLLLFRKSKKKDLTVSKLMHIIERKKWIDA